MRPRVRRAGKRRAEIVLQIRPVDGRTLAAALLQSGAIGIARASEALGAILKHAEALQRVAEVRRGLRLLHRLLFARRLLQRLAEGVDRLMVAPGVGIALGEVDQRETQAVHGGGPAGGVFRLRRGIDGGLVDGDRLVELGLVAAARGERQQREGPEAEQLRLALGQCLGQRRGLVRRALQGGIVADEGAEADEGAHLAEADLAGEFLVGAVGKGGGFLEIGGGLVEQEGGSPVSPLRAKTSASAARPFLPSGVFLDRFLASSRARAFACSLIAMALSNRPSAMASPASAVRRSSSGSLPVGTGSDWYSFSRCAPSRSSFSASSGTFGPFLPSTPAIA